MTARMHKCKLASSAVTSMRANSRYVGIPGISNWSGEKNNRKNKRDREQHEKRSDRSELGGIWFFGAIIINICEVTLGVPIYVTLWLLLVVIVGWSSTSSWTAKKTEYLFNVGFLKTHLFSRTVAFNAVGVRSGMRSNWNKNRFRFFVVFSSVSLFFLLCIFISSYRVRVKFPGYRYFILVLKTYANDMFNSHILTDP